MIKRLFLGFLLFTSVVANAQQKVALKNFKAEFEVPADWNVQEYFKGDWDKPAGSAICHCALAVSILKVPVGDDFDYLHMVIYPSDKKGSTDPQRLNVWQYKITRTGGDSIKTPNMQWIHFNGKLTTQGDNRFKDHLAWIYQTHENKMYYTIYFWAKPGMLSQYKTVIEKIIKGFKSL